ncbi:MAG: signal peptide peptidase SppA [Bacteroidales bacterium]|nr:signal peptide peptidase SppA [Bacteroidales bacterium]
MKDFFKYMLASALGVIIVMGIIFFISFGLIMGIMAFTEQKEFVVKENTIIRIDFKDPIPERTSKEGIFGNIYSGTFKRVLGLNDIVKNINHAADDENIEGIVLNLNMVPSGIATLGEIRDALLNFKEGGKFILCYGEYMTQSAYYLGSVADEFYIHPQGFVDFKGLNAELMFLKGMFDKLDMDMQVVRYGKFKSAVEPLIQKEMSPENREQYSAFIQGIWSSMLDDIAESRGLSSAQLNVIANELSAYDAEGALSYGLIDATKHRDEFREVISKQMLLDFEDINFVSLSQYDRVIKTFPVTKDRIAVIYATGQIGGGQGNDMTVGSDRLAETISKARKDENVKAVVFRINSPGGDALASDVIWREMSLLQDEKPVIVSMGDVAASGGYWIACASDKIIAYPTSLTGSIGVFGVIPNIGGFMENKLGISYDHVKTNENAGFPSVLRPLTDYERKVLEHKIENVYDLFLGRVSENRNMSREAVDEIGEGRVWSGIDAKRLGLIDDFGGLYDAIDVASEIAGLEEYRLLELPVQKDPLEQLIEELSAGTYSALLKAELGVFYKDYVKARSAMEMNGIQARLPVSLSIE